MNKIYNNLSVDNLKKQNGLINLIKNKKELSKKAYKRT